MSSTVTLPETEQASGDSASLHWRALEGLYGSAPVNTLFESRLEVVAEGVSRIHFNVTRSSFHAAGAAHA